MHFTVSSFFTGLIFGAIGIYLFRIGKKEFNYSWMGIGVALMAYPFFMEQPVFEWGVGIALTVLAYYLR